MSNPDPKDFPSNSIKRKEPKPVKKITSGKVVKRQEPLISRMLYSETSQNIVSYILWDVLIPAAKSTLTDMITSIPEFLFYQGESRGKRFHRDRGRSYVSYQSYYGDKRRERRPVRQRSHVGHQLSNVLIEDLWDAEEVLDQLTEAVDVYGTTSVADFYVAVNIDPDTVDFKWGWDNLSSAYVKRVRGGHILVLPKPMPLD